MPPKRKPNEESTGRRQRDLRVYGGRCADPPRRHFPRTPPSRSLPRTPRGSGNRWIDRRTRLCDIAVQQHEVTAVLPLRPVAAIVATQDCDAVRVQDITLCEIRPFRQVERKSLQTTAPKKWKDLLTQHARINQKWFYLPPDNAIGFNDKMAVDFMVTLRVPRVELEALRDLRKGRLNSVADYPWQCVDADS